MGIRQFLCQTTIPFREIAEKTGVHLCQVYRWSYGKSSPSGSSLAALIEFLRQRGLVVEIVGRKVRILETSPPPRKRRVA